jgi:hypothetical protein
MSRWSVFVLVVGCAVPANRPAQVASRPDYCRMVLETAGRILGPFTDDYTTLEEGCVRQVATASGITYAEGVGFDPMPVDTITCEGRGWIVRIGQKPTQAPTQGVVLLGFEKEEGGARKFSARVERAEWRQQPNRVVMNGCGTVEGTVTRKGNGWVANTEPQKFD